MRKHQTSYTCAHCGDSFWRRLTGNGIAPRYCDAECYRKARWGTGTECRHCGKPAATRFCDKRCQRSYWSAKDKERGPERRSKTWDAKCAFLMRLGGKCVRCGNADLRVLDVDHIDPKKKRKPRNNTLAVRLALWRREIKNIQLLCANCHRLKTHEQSWRTLPTKQQRSLAL